jgi:hypothetical protein
MVPIHADEVVEDGHVFISVRADEDNGAAVKLKDALDAAGISTFLRTRDSLFVDIVSALDACDLFIVLGTQGYGKQDLEDQRFSTQQELQFAANHRKPVFLIKRCNKFEDPRTRMCLPESRVHFEWLSNDDNNLPSDLVDNIRAKLRTVPRRPALQAAASNGLPVPFDLQTM